MTHTERHRMLALRDGCIAAVAVLIIAVLTGCAIYFAASKSLQQQAQDNLLVLARSAASLTDGDMHSEIVRAEQKDTPLYDRLREPYRLLRKANVHLGNITTVIKRNGKLQTVLVASDDEASTDILQPLAQTTEIMEAAFNQQKDMVEDAPRSHDGGVYLRAYAPFFNHAGEFIGIVSVEQQINDLLAQGQSMRTSLIIGMLVASVAAILCGVAVWTMRCATYVARYQCEEQRNLLITTEKKHKEFIERQKITAEQERRNLIFNLATSLEQSIADVIVQVDGCAVDVQQKSRAIAQQTKDADAQITKTNDTAHNAIAHTHSITEAAKQLSDSIGEISKQTFYADKIAHEANISADTAKKIITHLEEQSKKVSDFTAIITKIAGQINLLALNATIESARAGEAGKGFAVVAGEVKQLAMQVAQASKHITGQIHEMEQATRASVEAVEHTITVIGTMKETTQAVASAVVQQSAASSDMARSIQSSTKDTQCIRDNLMQIQQGAAQTSAQGNDVLASTEKLTKQASQLQQTFREFIAGLKS